MTVPPCIHPQQPIATPDWMGIVVLVLIQIVVIWAIWREARGGLQQ